MIRRIDLDARRKPPRWPNLGAWELDGFWKELRRSILALEAASGDATLGERLNEPGLLEAIGPDLFSTYRALARRSKPDASAQREKRREVVHALLDQLHGEAFAVRTFGVARGSIWQKKPVLETWIEGGAIVRQRLDQVAARRFWGLGFSHEDDAAATDELARYAVLRSVRRFARDLRDLADVLRRLPDPAAVMVPRHADRRFEQLMLDILDENFRRAEVAGLAEDFCQKTDLRVRYPGLERARGARVQVKAARSQRVHQLRIADIRNRETLVILSPVALAEFLAEIVSRRVEAPIERAQLDAFWRSIPGEPTTIDELAPALGRLFDAAIRSQPSDPRGPMAQVPEAVRAMVRAFVRYEAFRSTEALRRKEASGTRYRRAPDGRLRAVDGASPAS